MASKRKQKLKRYMKKAFKTVATSPIAPTSPIKTTKAVTIFEPDETREGYLPPYQENYEDPLTQRFEVLNKVGQDKLDSVYLGQIKIVSRYYNDQSIMSFQCESCGLVFFGKISKLTGHPNHHHHCHTDYGGRQVNNKSGGYNKSKKNTFNLAKFNQLIWEGYDWKEIAREMKVNPMIIKYYFESEGLL